MSGERLARIRDVVQQLIDAGRIQGAVVAVGRRGKVVYFEVQGVSDEETRAPMQRDAMFQMASSTKPVLGVAAMMMIEEGLFKPTDAVYAYIPEFKDIQVAVLQEPADEDISPLYVLEDSVPAHRLVDAHRPISIHDLLTHTSGLASYGLGMAVSTWDWQDETLATWIPKVAAGPLDFQPGARWAYSGTVGLDVVARIIEIVSGTLFNAGWLNLAAFKDQEPAHWQGLFETNVVGMLNTTSVVFSPMLERRAGTIINIGSTAGHRYSPNHTVYVGTKYAVRGLTEGLRAEAAGRGVRVVLISPGLVDTELLNRSTQVDLIEAYQANKDRLRGGLRPADVAGAVLFAYQQPQEISVREMIIAPTGSGN